MTPEVSTRIETALGKGGIKMWELYPVNNVDTGRAGPPPLELTVSSYRSTNDNDHHHLEEGMQPSYVDDIAYYLSDMWILTPLPITTDARLPHRPSLFS
eukprot:gene3645-7272_t